MVSYLKDTEGVAGRVAIGRITIGHYLNEINVIMAATVPGTMA